MTQATLAWSGGVYLLSAIAFAVAFATLRARPPPDRRDRLAASGFLVWWGGLSLYMTTRAGLAFYAAAGATDLAPFLWARSVTIPMLTAATAGLVFHLLYLFTGRTSLLAPVVAFYGAVTVAFYVTSLSQSDAGARIGTWLPELVYDDPVEAPLYRAVLVAVGVPPILGSLAYLSLLRRVDERLLRYRIVLVSCAILLWVGSGLGARLAGGEFLSFVTLAVFGVFAALLVIAAYRPPRRLLRHLQVAAVFMRIGSATPRV